MPSVVNQRAEAIKSFVQREPRTVEFHKPAPAVRRKPSEIFAENVLTLGQLQVALPKPIFERLLAQQAGEHPIDKPTADAVAHAAKVWAIERGATHFTHWFQPQTDATAEKHDSFLSLKYNCQKSLITTTAIDSFSGKELVQAEPDASSFPNGGTRSTFEARGYTVWDTNSPMFLRDGPHGTKVLYIPSVFISYNGEALDEKTILLRSSEALNKKALELISLIGETGVHKVIPTLGCEQEFFLVDRQTYSLRPDLKLAGRTLVGRASPKHQQLEDHYFGRIPSRVLACLSEAELELWRLGVPIKTRHNEVAPQQFEVAPIFEADCVAVDHNLLTMEILHNVAHRHHLRAIFHEKPFKGVNGSGKHCNWSLQTDTGENLLEPSDKPEENYRFLLFLAAILWGVKEHQGLLRAAIGSSSNQWRLGANEAPPSIISVFLGAQLNGVCEAIEEGCAAAEKVAPAKVKTIAVGSRSIDLKIQTIPSVNRDATDRNRTSPFAFTGNKFEFRAVGSKQSPSFPVAMINAATTSGLHRVIDELKSHGPVINKDSITKTLRSIFKECKEIRFEGDGYSKEWRAEAEKRKLLNIKTEPEAFAQLLTAASRSMLTKQTGILSSEELESRFHVKHEMYAKDMVIEAKTLANMVSQYIVPAAFKYRAELMSTISAASKTDGKTCKLPEEEAFEDLNEPLTKCQEGIRNLLAQVEKIENESSIEKASHLAVHLVAAMESIRVGVDRIESILSDEYYPFPKYTELLFN